MVRKSLRLLWVLTTATIAGAVTPSLIAQTGQTAAPSAPAPQTVKPQTGKAPAVGPTAPQSTHYPILLLAFGSDPAWSLRLGQKGPERLDRPHYPPITLEPAEVTHDTGVNSWTYHAKDTATGATVLVHLSREACVGPTPPETTPVAGGGPASVVQPNPAKFTFRAVVEHTQIGTLNGCARIAAELFPR